MDEPLASICAWALIIVPLLLFSWGMRVLEEAETANSIVFGWALIVAGVGVVFGTVVWLRSDR